MIQRFPLGCIVAASSLLLAGALSSCQKSIADGNEHMGPEIALSVNSSDMVQTKTTAVTAVPSNLYWAATTGTSGSAEVRKYVNKNSAVTTESVLKRIYTGKYQTATPTAYNWYVANQAITVPESSGAVTLAVANNNTDVVTGVCKNNATSNPPVNLNHIFCRTGRFTLNTQVWASNGHTAADNYKLSNVSWKIKSKTGSGMTGGTAGTYNIGTNTWSGTTALAEQAIGTVVAASTNENVNVQDSDLYITPGVYVLTVTYTLSKYNDNDHVSGTIDYTKTFTKSVEVTFVQGSVNNITATAVSGDAQEIIIDVTLTDWGTVTHTPALPV